ncbi:ankyrin repeat domain-containing protein 29 isoform X6 [Elephas maximus indicus]|uniref:ankyrin repeat domain-containing protein 29 isoform X6 n=1 Tax=Elephas maximus indicus TaxID=99487 RepID=UPI0021160EDA|nr:ankyrin repeat domain-containing protein 29 isoform X6 [Elephas maximus indicus]
MSTRALSGVCAAGLQKSNPPAQGNPPCKRSLLGSQERKRGAPEAIVEQRPGGRGLQRQSRHYAPHGRLLCWSPELCAGAGSTGSRHQSPERGWSHCTLPGCPRWLLGCHSITLVFRSKSQPAKDGTAPLWIASQMGHSEVVRVMLLRGAERDAARNDGTTALLKAANKGYSDVIEELLKFSPTLGILKNGTSALHAAVLSGNIKTVALLLEAGADPALRNKANELPAELTTNERILRLLRSKEPHRKS